MFGFLILAALAVFVAVVAVRTAQFKPKAQPATNDEEIVFDKDGATAALAELVKCKTISYSDPELEDDAEFDKLIAKLQSITGKQIELTNKLDPATLGGMRLYYDGKRVDDTVSHRLDAVRAMLQNTVL